MWSIHPEDGPDDLAGIGQARAGSPPVERLIAEANETDVL